MYRKVNLKLTMLLILILANMALDGVSRSCFAQDLKRIKWQIDQMSRFSCDVVETRKFVDGKGLLKREATFINRLEFALEDPRGYKLVQRSSMSYDHKGLYDNGLATLISILMWSEYQWQSTLNPTMFYVKDKGTKKNANMLFEGNVLLATDSQVQCMVGGFKYLSHNIEHLNIIYQLSPVYSREGIVYLPSLVLLSARSKGAFVSDGYNELRLEYTNWRDRKLSASSFEEDIFGLVNAVRRQNNLPALKLNDSLTPGAREHSKNLALYGYGSDLHVDAFGKRFQARAKNGARKEIVAFSNEKNPVVIVNQWLQSPRHKEAILSHSKEAGVGVYEKDGIYYATQWFK